MFTCVASCSSSKGKKDADLFHGKEAKSIPLKNVKLWSTEVVGAYTGPKCGFTKLDLNTEDGPSRENVAGSNNWNMPTEFSYGISLSLYETLPPRNGASQGFVGDPIADVFGVLTLENSAILALADGVGWGKKPRLAARCAVHGVMQHMAANMAEIRASPNTHCIANLLLEAVTEKAHQLILERDATLSTLSAAVLCELEGEEHAWGLVTVTVGDSPVYVYSPHEQKVTEVSVGSHQHDGQRDMRMSGGTLGPSKGKDPDLSNLSLAYMTLFPGDIVFCTSDGISDNFLSSVIDPVVVGTQAAPTPACVVSKTAPHASQQCCESAAHMTEVLQKHHQTVGKHLSAQTLCACLVNHVAILTEQKRLSHSLLDNTSPDFRTLLKQVPGKLDHASIVAFQVDLHHKIVSTTGL